MKISRESRNKCNLYINTYNRYYLTGKYCGICVYNGECQVMGGKKTYKIKAVIKANPFFTSEVMIADMLRYDAMQIVDKAIEGDKIIFTLKGETRYTPKRWASFGVKTELI